MTVAVLASLLIVAIALPIRARVARPSSRPAARSAGESRPARTRWGRARRWVPALVLRARRLRSRRSGVRPAAAAEWCAGVAREVRSGASLRGSLASTVPADDAVRAATEPLRIGLERGRDLADVADATARRPHGAPGVAHVALACSVISVCAQAGGSAAAPLDRVAATLRERAADDHDRAAHAAQARLSAHVMTVLPVAMLAVLAAADPSVRAAVASPVGSAGVALGVTLNASGWIWMRRIIRGRPA